MFRRKVPWDVDEQDDALAMTTTTSVDIIDSSVGKDLHKRRRWGLSHVDKSSILVVLFFLFIGLFLSFLSKQKNHYHQPPKQNVIPQKKGRWNHHHNVSSLVVPAQPQTEQIISLQKDDNNNNNNNNNTGRTTRSSLPRYVTVVLPSVVKPKGRANRLKSIQYTWGPGSRAVVVTHNVSNFPLQDGDGTVDDVLLSQDVTPKNPSSYPQMLLLPTDIKFDDGLERLYYTIRTVFQQINPDFAFFVNDHTFVVPEHLCKFLEDRDPSQDLYAGHAMKNGKTEVFNSGAAGYILSRSTMTKIVHLWDQKDPSCFVEPDKASKWIQGNPGLITVKCLNALDIYPIDTRADHKWHRFHAFPLTREVSGSVDDWYIKKHMGAAELLRTDPTYDTLLHGEDCCSMDTISFHYVEYKESLALFRVRKVLLQNSTMSSEELQNLILKEWPSNRNEIGYYSHPLPKETEKELWLQFMTVLRKISTPETQRNC